MSYGPSYCLLVLRARTSREALSGRGCRGQGSLSTCGLADILGLRKGEQLRGKAWTRDSRWSHALAVWLRGEARSGMPELDSTPTSANETKRERRVRLALVWIARIITFGLGFRK